MTNEKRFATFVHSLAGSGDEREEIRYFRSLIGGIKQRTRRDSLLSFTHWRDQATNEKRFATFVHSLAGSGDEREEIRYFRSLIGGIR